MKNLNIRKLSHQVIRWAILLAVLGYVSREFYAHMYVSKVSPSVHALCPMGGLESLLRFITSDGATLAKVFSGTMGLFFVSIGLTLLFKRSFCGTICPLGTLQGLAGKLGRKILGPQRFVVPPVLDRVLRFLKYPILALTVIMAFATGTLWIMSFDPWPAYAHLFNPAEIWPAYGVGLIILVLSLVASFFYEMAFCKYLCPMGALTAVVGLVSPYKVRRQAHACTSCGLCDRACPVNIKVSSATAISNPECLSCGDCVAVCPHKGAIGMGYSSKWSIPPAAAVALAVGVFFLGLLVLQLAGFDRFSGPQEPTVRELAKSMGITSGEFKKQYGLPENLFDGTRSSAIQDAIPLAKMAELEGTTPGELKTLLGLDPALDDATPWGTAWGMVKLSKICELNGLELEQLKTMAGLPDHVGPDTPWMEVRTRVEAALARQAGAGHGGGSCPNE